MADSLRIAAIVEGHGEVPALPILLRRLGQELLGGRHIEVATPIRHPRSQLVKPDLDTLKRAVLLASRKVQALLPEDAPTLVLVMIDSDEDCPAILGPELKERAAADSPHPVAVVLPKVEFETWFVAAAESLSQHLDLDAPAPPDPESSGAAKKWIAKRFLGGRYSETVDQPKLCNAMDLQVCRDHSLSFAKLCRELENAFKE